MESQSLMQSLNQKKSLVEDDAKMELFLRRNKIIVFVFTFITIISSTLIIVALVIQRVHNNSNTRSHAELVKSPIGSFCSASDSLTACIEAINPIVNGTVILDPDQILTVALQLSVSEIQNIVDNSSTVSEFHNCSRALRHALSQLGATVAELWVNPFVSSLSEDQREVIRKRVVAAADDVKACVDDLAAGGAAAAEKLAEVEVYLDRGRDFLFRYELVLRNWNTGVVMSASYEISKIYDYLFEIVMCGIQVAFMIGMFCALFKIR